MSESDGETSGELEESEGEVASSPESRHTRVRSGDITEIVQEYEGNLNLLESMRGVDPAVLQKLVALRQKNAEAKRSQDEERLDTLNDFLTSTAIPDIVLLRRVKRILKTCPIRFLDFFLVPVDAEKNGLERLGEILQYKFVNLLHSGGTPDSPLASARSRLTIKGIGASIRGLWDKQGRGGGGDESSEVDPTTRSSGEVDGILELNERDELVLMEVVFLFKCCIRNERGFRGLLADPALLRKLIVLHSRLHLTRNVKAREMILQFLTMMAVVNDDGHDSVLDALSDDTLAVFSGSKGKKSGGGFRSLRAKRGGRRSDSDAAAEGRNPFQDVVLALTKHTASKKRGEAATLSKKYMLTILTFLNANLVRASTDDKPRLVLQLLDAGLLPVLTRLTQKRTYKKLPRNIQNHLTVLRGHIGDVTVHPSDLADQMLRRIKTQEHLSLICSIMSDLVNASGDGLDRRLKYYSFLVDSNFVNRTKSGALDMIVVDYTSKVLELQEEISTYRTRFEVVIRAIMEWSEDKAMKMIQKHSFDPILCRILSKLWAQMTMLNRQRFLDPADEEIADEDIDAAFEAEGKSATTPTTEPDAAATAADGEAGTSSEAGLSQPSSEAGSGSPDGDATDTGDLLLAPDADDDLMAPPDADDGLLMPPGEDLMAPPGGDLMAPPGGGMMAPPGSGGRLRRRANYDHLEIAKLFHNTKEERQQSLSRFMRVQPISTRKLDSSIFMKKGISASSHGCYTPELQSSLVQFLDVRKKSSPAATESSTTSPARATATKQSILDGKDARALEISLRTMRKTPEEIRVCFEKFDEEFFSPSVVLKVYKIVKVPTRAQWEQIRSIPEEDFEQYDMGTRFLRIVGTVPSVVRKAEMWSWKNDYVDFSKSLRPPLEEFVRCSEILKTSEEFHSFLQYVLVVANMLSKNKAVIGFRMKSLENLVMLKAGGRTLLEFLVGYLKDRNEERVLSWAADFRNLRVLVGVNFDSIRDDIAVIAGHARKLETLLGEIADQEESSPFADAMGPFLERVLNDHGQLESLYADVQNLWTELGALFGEAVDYIKESFFKDLQVFVGELQKAKKAYLLRKRREDKKRRRVERVEQIEAERPPEVEEKVIDIITLQDLINSGAIFQQATVDVV